MTQRLLALALLPALLAGCATKRDLRDLRTEIQQMQAAQEALIRELQRSNERHFALVMDSLSRKDVRLRGDLTNQLVQIERQLVQVQELTGQGQQGLAQLREDLRAREAELRVLQQAQPPAGETPAGNPDELLSSAREALTRGSFATARAGFEEFVRAFPRDPRAAEAQLGVGETYEKAKDVQRAVDAYSQVLELFPDSPRAATALYRAAILERDRGNRDRARAMLNQITTAYPRSEEAAQARTALQRLR